MTATEEHVPGVSKETSAACFVERFEKTPKSHVQIVILVKVLYTEGFLFTAGLVPLHRSDRDQTQMRFNTCKILWPT